MKKRKLGSQLKAKEEAGEVRHEVDFEQLKIENKQFSEKFEEKNEELLKLKLSAGNTLQVLNSYKVSGHPAVQRRAMDVISVCVILL